MRLAKLVQLFVYIPKLLQTGNVRRVEFESLSESINRILESAEFS